MKDAHQTRFLAIALAVLTLGACLLAALNFRQEAAFEQPIDGVWWVEATGGLRAEKVSANSPAERAGIKDGDLLVAINERPTPRLAPAVREMFRSGVWAHASYSILRPARFERGRPSAKLDVQVILEPADRSIHHGFRLIALIYLSIGIYVLFRRWTAPKATHFYLFCLISFVLYSFKYTGKLDTFDWIIFWANLTAAALQPALFLHFAITFADRRTLTRGRQLGRAVAIAIIYVPGALLIGLQTVAISSWSATEVLRHRLDQIGVGYLAFYYVLAAAIFWSRYRLAAAGLERQQLKWLTRGTILAVLPFTILYAIPYMADLAVPGALTRIAGLSLVFVPLTFSWAIVRYRLMDVDLIFKRGVTYTLATAALVGVYFSIVAITAEMVHTRLPNLRVWGLVAAVTITGIVFDPLKRVIQARVDRVFDQKRFDYRETLVNFGRGLSSLTDLRTLIDTVVERIPRTLLVTRVAIFLPADPESAISHRFELAASHGLANPKGPESFALDIGFVDFDQEQDRRHIFFENPQQVLRLPESQRQTAARLDLNYYIPCRVASHQHEGTRTVAVIGLGQTREGDFLSSEDVELLESLAGYIAIAIQNAQLYKTLERKITEFETLKEYNESIVESVNVGVLAVDLEDRIESWNQQMEVMFNLPREHAIGLPLSSIFHRELTQRLGDVRGDSGTCTLYKFRLNLRSGETRTTNIAITPMISRNSEMTGRILLIDDITDRMQLEEQLTQAEKLSSIGLLAAGVAHEVNTPLAVISSYTQMLTKQMSADKRLTPILEKITQQSFRASEIVNGLLNFSRTGTTAFTDIDLNVILRDTLNLVEHQLKTARIEVEMSLDPHLPSVRGNQGKLQQVFLNLFLNAKDAMFRSPSARLRVTTAEISGMVVLRMEDTGSGIKPEHLQRIYDPFFTTKTLVAESGHKGTGLGLAVTYGIMQEHAGKIHVDSQEGAGTTFTLEFPIGQRSAATPRLPIETDELERDHVHG